MQLGVPFASRDGTTGALDLVMPTSTEILEELATIADAHPQIAIAWHIAMLLAVVWFVVEPPSTERATLFVVAPVVSVFLAAAGHVSWFNAASFALLAILLLAFRGGLAPHWRTDVPAWSTVSGAALILVGAVYPAFGEAPWYQAIFTAPVGLLPCPTLLVVAGFTLLAGGFGSRTIPGLLGMWAFVYGAFGAFSLGVTVDLALLAGAFGLFRLAVRNADLHDLTPAKSAT